MQSEKISGIVAAALCFSASACGQVEGTALVLTAMVMTSWGWHAPSGRWRYPDTSPGVDFELRETSAEPEARLIDDLREKLLGLDPRWICERRCEAGGCWPVAEPFLWGFWW